MNKKVIFISLFVIGLIIGLIVFFINIDKSSKVLELTYENSETSPYKWKFEI